MGKAFARLLCTIGASLSLYSAEKLPPAYQITYGDPSSPIHITEYFSLSCPQCLKYFHKSFKSLKNKYINTHQVHFSFHLNPADLLTLQAMVCLEKLQDKEKIIFWEVLLDNLNDLSQGCSLMQMIMEALGEPTPLLDQLSFLETTATFNASYQYLRQPDTVQDLPSIEINGTLYDELPTFKFIEKKIAALSETRITDETPSFS